MIFNLFCFVIEDGRRQPDHFPRVLEITNKQFWDAMRQVCNRSAADCWGWDSELVRAACIDKGNVEAIKTLLMMMINDDSRILPATRELMLASELVAVFK